MLKSIFKKRYFVSACFCLLLSAGIVSAQTQSISYQGFLKDGGVPANGVYDFVFKLYNSNGVQFSFDVPVNDVQVTNGVFNVLIPFDETPGIFAIGSRKFLEITVRPGASTGAYTTLAPRQEFGSVPSAVSSRYANDAGSASNAFALDGIPSNQFVRTTDARLSDARNPLAGSANYIQNSTTQQGTSNFNISGNGTVGGTLSGSVVNAGTQFNLAGSKILGANALNLFVGWGAGSSMTTGEQNSFFGEHAGFSNTSGLFNSFFGSRSGYSNTGGGGNSFFGTRMNSDISCFGTGFYNTTGSHNSFFGNCAGEKNTFGGSNSFFGGYAGLENTSGGGNSFFGRYAGIGNTTGSFNNLFGYNSDVGAGNLVNATAIGTDAFVTQSNSLVLGSIAGINGASDNTNIGIGTTAPNFRLHLKVNGQDGIKLQHTGTGLYPQVRWTDANDVFKASLGYGSGVNEGLRLFVNGSDRLVIQNDGVVRSNGGIFIANPNTLVITSPNGACWGVTVNNSGALSTFSATCP